MSFMWLKCPIEKIIFASNFKEIKQNLPKGQKFEYKNGTCQ